jgi:hypothetical protein
MIARVRQKAAAEAAAAEEDVPEDAKQKADTEMGRDKAAAKPIADPEMNPANQNDNPGPKVLFVEEEHVKEDSPSVGTPVVCVRVEKGFKYYTME